MDANDSQPLKIRKLCEVRDASQRKDGISLLPDDILLDILSFLTTKEIIRTSILSKRWQNLWISIPKFHFDFEEYDNNSTLRASFIPLVHKALLLRNDLCIRKFHLSTCIPISMFSIFVWITAALEHEVQKLDLSLQYEEGDCLLPPDLFTSESLSEFKLALFYGRLILPSSIYFFSLKSLYLSCVEFPDDKSTEQLFCGCPVLEELVLENCCWTNLNNVTLGIPSLRKFTVRDDYCSNDALLDCKIKICAVNLISFHWTNYMIVELLLESLSSLVYAYVDAMISGNPYEPRIERLVKLLSGIRRVKSVSLSNDTLEFLLLAETLLPQVLLPTYDKLTHLSVLCESSVPNICHCEALMHFLQTSPNLESLDINGGIDLEGTLGLEILPHCIMSCLKSFSLSCFRWDAAEIRLLKYLFEKAVVLEQVTVYYLDDEIDENVKKQVIGSDEDVKKQEIIHQLNILHSSSGFAKCVIKFV